MVDVVCLTGVEGFVPLACCERVAGVEKAAVRLTGNRLSGSKIVEAPEIRIIIIVCKGAMDNLEARLWGSRRNLGIASMQAFTGVILENIGRAGAR